MKHILFIAFIIANFFACRSEKTYVPKPRMYPKIDFPDKNMETKVMEFCDFQFRAPSYMDIKQEVYFFDDFIQHPCWFDLNSVSLNTSIHCSYYPINKEYSLDQLVYDAFSVTNKHNIKATYIDDFVVKKPIDEVYGMIFLVNGPVASPLQFYLTDSTNHFFRASLYFNTKVDTDSTAIILKYIQEDIDTIIGSWKWNG